MRSTWTDSRLDDFKGTVDTRFDELNGRVGSLSVEVREMRGEIGSLQRTLIQVGAGRAGTILVSAVGLIGTLIATQL